MSNQYNVIRFVPISSGPELTLEMVSRKEEGTYQCKADNGVGQTKYKKVDLFVTCKFLICNGRIMVLGVFRLSPREEIPISM